jgi:hypothetical protein
MQGNLTYMLITAMKIILPFVIAYPFKQLSGPRQYKKFGL